MKRLVLATAIALAVSTVGVGPALADRADSATTIEAGAKPPAPGDDSPEGTVETDDSGSADGQVSDPTEGEDAADSGETTRQDEDTTDPDGNTGKPSESPSAESEPIDARFTLDKTEMTAAEIADPQQGIGYTIDSLRTGDVVTAEPGQGGSTTVDSNGTFDGTILGNTELKTGDTLTVTVTVARTGQEPKNFTGTVEVVAADDDTPDAELTVSPKTQGVDSFLKDGVRITLANCVMDEVVNFSVVVEDDPNNPIWKDTQYAAGEDAAGFTTFIPDGGEGTEWTGEYTVTASCGEQSAEASFTVTDGGSLVEPELSVDPKLSVDPETVSGADFINRDKGVRLTVTECEPGSDVQFEVWGHEPGEQLYEQVSEADENGAASVQVYGLDDRPNVYVGTYSVFATCMEQNLEAEFVVIESGGSDGAGDSADAGTGSMPRTGAEITGLGAGALLVLGGAASIIFARRRTQADR